MGEAVGNFTRMGWWETNGHFSGLGVLGKQTLLKLESQKLTIRCIKNNVNTQNSSLLLLSTTFYYYQCF